VISNDEEIEKKVDEIEFVINDEVVYNSKKVEVE